MVRPNRANAAATIAVTSLLLCAQSVSAQIGQPIVQVVLEQEGQRVTDPEMLALVETTVGEPLAMRDVRETTTRFMSLSRFEDVRSYADGADGGIRVRYDLVPLHPVDRVAFSGRLGMGGDRLRRVVQERHGAAPPASRAADVVATLREEYRRRGYSEPRIAPRIVEAHDPDRATMLFDIDAGPRAVVGEVMLLYADEREADTAIGVPVIPDGRPYDAEEVERILERWEDRMRDRGYYEARATHGASFPVPTEAYLRVTITRGPRVVIAFAGDPLPEEERDRLVPVRTERSADEDLLEDSARAIERYFFARGYRDAAVTYTPREQDGELVITFDIRQGPRYRIRTVAVQGNTALSTTEARELLQVKEGDLFVDSVLDAGETAIRNVYLTRGFTRIAIEREDAVIVPEAADAPERGVNVTVAITEGPRTVVRAIAFEGNAALAEAQLRRLVPFGPGEAYSESEVLTARDNVELEYRNRGFDTVSVKPEVTRAEGDTQADVTFQIAEGQQSIVDHIIVLGNERTDSETIGRELLLVEGEPLGYTALIESRSRVMALGLFSGVQIEPIGQSSQGGRRDVIVRVQEAPPNSIGLGGGVEGGYILRPTGPGGIAEERFELAPRGFFEIGRRNLWGKNREVNLFTRVSLRSRDVVLTDSGERLPDDMIERGVGFHEYRVIGTFREPRAFATAADVLVTGIFEQAIRSSFNFSRRIARAEAGLRLSREYSMAGRYSFERTKLFDEVFTADEKPPIDRLFPEVRLSKIAGSLLRDTRDDLVDTSSGTLLVVDADLAARAIGSEVGFVKTYVQGFTFHRLPTARRVIAAFAGRIGAAHGFPREVPRVDASGAPAIGVGGTQIVDVVQDLPASERFFAGGDTSVRGFSLDRLGNEQTISPTGFPTGGNGVAVFNAELRVSLTQTFQAVGFLDAGNVFPRASDLNLTDLRPAAGGGFRYRSPFGPIRFDLGFNLDRRELVAGVPERRMVFHVSLGQAF
jgi:outer membrane protein assembly complex protein YaeT